MQFPLSRYSVEMDRDAKLIGTGIAGALLAMLCCFTPLLIIVMASLGLAAHVAKLDFVLIPLFVASLALVIFAIARRRRNCPAKAKP